MGNTKGLSIIQRHALVALIAQSGTGASLEYRLGIGGRTLDSLVRRGLVTCPARVPGMADTYKLTSTGYLFALAQRRREQARMPLADVANPWDEETELPAEDINALRAIKELPRRTTSELFLQGIPVEAIFSLNRKGLIEIHHRTGAGGGLGIYVSGLGRTALALAPAEGGAR